LVFVPDYSKLVDETVNIRNGKLSAKLPRKLDSLTIRPLY